MSNLAVWCGFDKWETIWDASEDQRLRKTGVPNFIYPRDEIWVAATTVRGDGMVTIQAGLVRIN